MAVVFISPKKKQKIFFTSVGFVFIVIFSLIMGWIFLLKPSAQVSVEFNKPKVTINFKVLDQDQFKNLETFSSIQPQFSYTARDKSKKEVTGFVSADKKEDAMKILQDRGFSDISLVEILSGRDNPYIPY